MSFAGNQAFTDRELQRAIATRASSCPFRPGGHHVRPRDRLGRDRAYYIPRVVEEDVERLQVFSTRPNGFRHASVESRVDPVDGGVAVEFVIDEGEPYRVGSVNFAGDSLPPELRIEEDLPIAAGDPLSDLYIQEARDTIQMRLRNAGYAWAEVFRRHLRPPARTPPP